MIDRWFIIQYKRILLSIWMNIGFYLWEFMTKHYDDRKEKPGKLCAITFSLIEDWQEIDSKREGE